MAARPGRSYPMSAYRPKLGRAIASVPPLSPIIIDSTGATDSMAVSSTVAMIDTVGVSDSVATNSTAVVLLGTRIINCGPAGTGDPGTVVPPGGDTAAVISQYQIANATADTASKFAYISQLQVQGAIVQTSHASFANQSAKYSATLAQIQQYCNQAQVSFPSVVAAAASLGVSASQLIYIQTLMDSAVASDGISIPVAPPQNYVQTQDDSVGLTDSIAVVTTQITYVKTFTDVAGTTDSFTAVTTPNPIGIPGSWRLILLEDFTGSSLNTTLWQPGWFGSGVTPPVQSSDLQCYDSTQVTVSGGLLHLTAITKAESCGGTSRNYASGMITTNPVAIGGGGGFQFTYGAVEARIFFPDFGGGKIANFPAFWLDGQSWPNDGEIDIVEGLSGVAAWHVHSPSGGPGSNVSGNFTGWHTYACDWEPGSVNFYYDGVNVGSVAYDRTSPNYIILNQAVSTTFGGGVLVPSDMQVDYVRVWQH